MTISDEELVRMAREYLDGIKIGNVGGNALANAILSRFEKRPRKCGYWAVLDRENLITNIVADSEEAARVGAKFLDEKESDNAPHWPCYVTGTEGIGPQDSTTPTEKREGREWTVYELTDRKNIASDPKTSFQSVPFRVREIIEGEGE